MSSEGKSILKHPCPNGCRGQSLFRIEANPTSWRNGVHCCEKCKDWHEQENTIAAQKPRGKHLINRIVYVGPSESQENNVDGTK